MNLKNGLHQRYDHFFEKLSVFKLPIYFNHNITHIMLIIFFVFAFIALFSALMILFTERVIHCAFWLLLSFLGVGACYVLMGADFLAVSQIVAYIGGVLVLLLFGVMLTTNNQAKNNEKIEQVFSIKPFFRIENLLSMGLLVWLMREILSTKKWKITPNISPQTTIYHIGTRLLTEHFLAFELVGVLLLMVLVGILVFTQDQQENFTN